MKGWVPVVFILVGAAAPVVSEDFRGMVEAGREQLQAHKKAIIMEAMKLDSAASEKFWPLYNEYQHELRKVNDKRVEVMSKYAKQYYSLTDEQAMALLREAFNADEERGKLRVKHLKRFEKVLPGKLVARFFQAENKLDAYVNASLAESVPLIPTESAEQHAADQTRGR